MDSAILAQVSGADDDRVCRALEAINSGAMQVEVLHNAGVLTAEVTSTVILGKKKPVIKTTTYNVLVSGTHYECTCPDWQYRSTLCKHIICAVIFAQSVSQEQRKAA